MYLLSKAPDFLKSLMPWTLPVHPIGVHEIHGGPSSPAFCCRLLMKGEKIWGELEQTMGTNDVTSMVQES